jgi:hypothetical protein
VSEGSDFAWDDCPSWFLLPKGLAHAARRRFTGFGLATRKSASSKTIIQYGAVLPSSQGHAKREPRWGQMLNFKCSITPV